MKRITLPKIKIYAKCGARTHDPEIKSLMLYRLSYPGIEFCALKKVNMICRLIRTP